jgi:purine-binding chemotaxis protein CheW
MEVERFCTFNLDGLWCGIAVETVQEVISSQIITPVPLAPSNVAGLINLRGQIITVVDLRPDLGIQAFPASALPMVVARSEGAAVALLVDAIGEVVESKEHDFEPAPGNLPAARRELVPKVCKFSEGLLHVLDLDQVLCSGQEVQLGKSLK